MAKRTRQGVPGQYKRGPSTVEVDLGLGRPQEGGIAVKSTYTLTTERIDGRYSLHLTYVSVDTHKGQVVASGVLDLPHAVLERMQSQRDGITAEAKRDRAKAGYQTRLAKAQAEAAEQGKPAPEVLMPFEQKGA